MPRDFDRNDLSDLRKASSGDDGTHEERTQQARTADAFAEDAAYQGSTRPPSAGVGAAASRVPPLPETPSPEAAQRSKSVWKILAILGAGCLGINVLLGTLAMLTFTLGLSSCVASCSDNPLGDSRENAAFIADRAATARDLEVMDALSVELNKLCDVLSGGGDEGAAYPANYTELRAQVAEGTWPEDEGGSHSPQVWVRIAELSEDWLERETSEEWEVVDFSYPFPNNGPIPVPATRDENSSCVTRLLCASGDDQGIFVTVSYYRWAQEAYFETALDEERQDAQELARQWEQLEDKGLLGNRPYVVSQGDLYVWAQGEDDELCDPATFVTCANQLSEALGDYCWVTLVAQDTPMNIGFETLSIDYPNDRPVETVTFEEGRNRLMRSDYVYFFDHAQGDVLLSGCCREEEPLTIENLKGTRAPIEEVEYKHSWRAPSEACTFDDEMAAEVADYFAVDAEQVIVASSYDTSDDLYNSLEAWLIVPGGTMPETPEAFCAAADAMRDAFWSTIPIDGEKRTQLYLHIFVIDEATLTTTEGVPVTFADLREAAQTSPASLDGYCVDLLLTTMPFVSQWGDDNEPHRYATTPHDVGGSIARSRAWRYGEE